MKIQTLSIGHFGNLRDFTASFDSNSLTTVLVGRNGTGKSHLLEAIVTIFRDLDLGELPGFEYSIVYERSGHTVSIAATTGKEPEIHVDGTVVSSKEFARKGASQGAYLPSYIFCYYSGSNDRMSRLFQQHQERFAEDLLRGLERPLRPLLYAREVHSQFVLMSFFCDASESDRAFLRDYLRIEALDSILFIMKKPGWYNPSRRVGGGDKRFWLARGVVQRILSQLYSLALAPVHTKANRSSITPYDYLYLYLASAGDLAHLYKEYAGQQDFFKALEHTYISELIHEVRTRVKIRHVDDSLTFRELADGEQQLLVVLGLLRLTQGSEVLFLLDEPDTHLNPAWCLDYIELLDKFAGNKKENQVILATHEPLVVASLVKEQVRLMLRDSKTGCISSVMPIQDPRGQGISSLLTSEIYKLKSELDPWTQGRLDRKRRLASQESLSGAEEAELEQLNKELDPLGFSESFSDPLLQQFSRAMADASGRPEFRRLALSDEDWTKLRILAKEIVDRLGLQATK